MKRLLVFLLALLLGASSAHAACWDADADGFFGPTMYGYERISDPAMRTFGQYLGKTAEGYPVVVWNRDHMWSAPVYATRWDGLQWVTMAGAPGRDTVPGTATAITMPLAVAFNGAGYPSVLFADGQSFFFSRWDGSAWSGMAGTPGFDRLPMRSNSPLQMQSPAMVLDSAGRPYITGLTWEFGVRDISFIHWNGAAWTRMDGTPGVENISSSAGDSWGPQIILDAADRPAIAWMDDSAGTTRIRLTHWDGTQWSQMDGTPGFETVDTGLASAYSTFRMAMATPNRLTLLWNERDPVLGDYRTYLRRWDGMKWAGMDGVTAFDDPTGGSLKGWLLSMALNASQNPVVVWADATGGLVTIRTARWDGMQWVRPPSSLVVSEGVKYGIPMVLDEAGNPYITWTAWAQNWAASYEIYFSRWDGTEWKSMHPIQGWRYEDIANDQGISRNPQIFLDAAGRPNVLWGGNATPTGELGVFYTSWNGEHWSGRVNPCGTPTDCNDYDRLVNPAAAEICTDRQDNDCDGLTDGQDPNCTVNLAPLANAGADETVHPGTPVTLDGSGSSDPDNHYPLGWAWTLASKPAGSATELLGAATSAPSFVPDLPGLYRAELVVTDRLGKPSAPDSVEVNTSNSAPVAEAGPDRAVTLVGSLVSLDGTQSFDDDGDPITHFWSFANLPLESAAAFDDPTSRTPSFVPDKHGTYEIRLLVRDPWAESVPDTLLVSFDNIAPVADAGVNQSVIAGTTVALDGSRSFDANGDPLAYRWSLVAVPEGSAAALADPAAAATSFGADLPGNYVISLVVDDGLLSSPPSNITVQAISTQDAVTEILQRLIALVNGFGDEAFVNHNMRKALTNKLLATIATVQAGGYEEAHDKLAHDLSGKTDGCAAAGAPDANDWLVACAEQDQVSPLIVRAMELLAELY